MKEILIYCDAGAEPFCVASLLWALKHEKVDQRFSLVRADGLLFQNDNWQKNAALVIFPGGRDIPYHRALKGAGNQSIKRFVQSGGHYLGICAGGYYGCAAIEFERGGPLEVIAERELQFFPGLGRGPAYGLGKFRYQNEEGAHVVRLTVSPSLAPLACASYYNGGCAFIEAETYEGISVLARYADIQGQPAAVISCEVGAGKAILSGVHPEYSAWNEGTSQKIRGESLLALKAIESQRRALFQGILTAIRI